MTIINDLWGNEYLSSVIWRWKDADEQGRRLLLLEQRRDSDNNLNILTLMDGTCSLQATSSENGAKSVKFFPCSHHLDF